MTGPNEQRPAMMASERMTGAEFSAALRAAKLDVEGWCNLVKMRRDRTLEWLAGDTRIPGWVPVLCAGLTVPAARETMLATGRHYLELERGTHDAHGK